MGSLNYPLYSSFDPMKLAVLDVVLRSSYYPWNKGVAEDVTRLAAMGVTHLLNCAGGVSGQ